MRLSLGQGLLPVFLLAALLLGGCLGSAPLSAMEAQEATDRYMAEQDPSMVLVFAAGLEGRVQDEVLRDLLQESGFDHLDLEVPSSEETGLSYWDALEADPRPGDGRSALWVMVYGTEGGVEERVLLVDKAGEIVHEESRLATGMNIPLGGYEVDSDAAMGSAVEASGELASLLDAPNLIIGSGLVHDAAHGGPVWTISAIGGSLQGVGGAWVQIDAVSGDVLHQDGQSIG
jgi:hypothetical protein